MNTPLIALAATVALGSLTAAAPRTPSEGQARIDVQRGETYAVRALFDGASDETLSYRLEVVREGAAGRSNSAQGGTFEATAGRTDTLSSVRVSAAQGDLFRATLVVTRDGVTVSEDVVEETVR